MPDSAVMVVTLQVQSGATMDWAICLDVGEQLNGRRQQVREPRAATCMAKRTCNRSLWVEMEGSQKHGKRS